MKVYRVYDNQARIFIKVGKRTNDLYVNKDLLIDTLKRYFNVADIKPRFDIYEYDLVKNRKI